MMEATKMGNNSERWDQVCEFTEKVRLEYKVPGVLVGILKDGDLRTAGFGVTNMDHPLEVTSDTLFQIGSITKTFTGTLIMKLAEEGKIDLDATVRTYLPDFKVADEGVSERVTIQHLLTHTSGWFGDFFHDTGPGADAGAKYVTDMADLEQMAPLGQVWSYNNAGFYLAGHIIEVVTGQPYQQIMREKILEPLGMNHTFFDPGDVITHRFATGHNEMKVARPWPLPRAAYPAGGITCRLPDLLAYASFHMGDGRTRDGESLFRRESLAQMQTPQVTVWKKESWGLTWSVNDTHGPRLVSHGGGTMGQVSQLILVPEKQFAVAVFTNAGEGGQVTLAVTRRVLDEYLGVKISDPEPLEVGEAEFYPYVGSYTRPFMDIHLGLLGGRLIGQVIYKMGFPAKDAPLPPPPPPFTLSLCEKDRLVVLDGPGKSGTADILRRPDGSIGWLRYGRIHKRMRTDS
jgi:CubicO group peptidase (beta-lactamase class C family)